MDYVTSLHQEKLIAVDIEVLREEVSHISLAKSPNDVMCLAMLDGVSETMNPEQEAQLWHEIARVLENERITKTSAKPPSTQTFCSAAESSVPVRPAAMPAAA